MIDFLTYRPLGGETAPLWAISIMGLTIVWFFAVVVVPCWRGD